MSLLDDIKAAFPDLTPETRDDGAIAALLSIGRTKVTSVAIADVQAYLMTHGLWWAIKNVPSDSPVYPAAVAALDVANARYTSIDTTLPIVGQMLGGLVMGGVITSNDMIAIMGMGVLPDPVSAQQVAQALEGS